MAVSRAMSRLMLKSAKRASLVENLRSLRGLGKMRGVSAIQISSTRVGIEDRVDHRNQRTAPEPWIAHTQAAPNSGTSWKPTLPLDEYKPTNRRINFHRKHPRLPSESRARAQTETRGRHPYLTANDAEELVAQSITAYGAHHRHVPARVVVLKTSRFRPEEAEGIDAPLKKFGIEMADLLWVQESSPIAVFRDGNYPVLRGTFIDLNGKGLLYTRGSVP
jgi:hypothetical protein